MGLGRVLIVDDEADLRKSLRLILTKAGYDAVEAEDGEKAIEAIRSGDNPLLVDTVICDLVMPKVNGMEAIATRPARTPAPPKTHHPQRSVTPPREHPWRKRLLPERGQHAATPIT